MNSQGQPGRPRIFARPEDMQAMVDLYVSSCEASGEPLTWTGLALGLGFSSRQSIDEYLNYPGFSDIVKRAKLLVENRYEKALAGNNAAGPIFVLKNMNWSDRQELAHTSPDGSMSPYQPLTDEQLERELETRGLPRAILEE